MPSIDADLLFSRLNSFLSCLHKLRPTLAAALATLGSRTRLDLFLLRAYWDFAESMTSSSGHRAIHSTSLINTIAELLATHTLLPRVSTVHRCPLAAGSRCSASCGRRAMAPSAG